MSVLQKAASILVECGYCDYASENKNYICWCDIEDMGTMNTDKMVASQFTADTLEGRRQLEAIWEYVSENHLEIFVSSMVEADTAGKGKHGSDVAVITRCLEELSK